MRKICIIKYYRGNKFREHYYIYDIMNQYSNIEIIIKSLKEFTKQHLMEKNIVVHEITIEVR